MTILFWLLVGHFVADMALQPAEMAKGKNRNRKPDMSEIPPGQKYVACWPYFLSGHAAVHAGAVVLVTGDPILGVCEFVCHWMIDFMKCESLYSPHVDQSLHFICKIAWFVAVV